MSSVILIFIFIVWHLSWNMALNQARGLKPLSMEQIAASTVAGATLQLLADWSVWATIALTFLANLAYYGNVVHARFFGHPIPLSHIKQFSRTAKTASSSAAMLIQSAGRLAKRGDIVLIFVWAETLAALFIVGDPDDPLWEWRVLNGALVVLVALTLRQYRRLKTGAMESHLFGMFVSYYFSWLLARRSRAEQERMREESAMLRNEDSEGGGDGDERADDDPSGDEWFGRFKGMNLILIQLESFQQFLLHRRAAGQEITPFLNRLARENLAFTDIFSQYAQGHTCDAELAVLQSLYPLKREVVNYRHYDKKFHGLPAILRCHGYQATAYHGYKGDFYNRRTMMKTYGFEAFYSEEDYLSTDRASYWMSDFSFFEQSVEKIKAMKPPFFSFTISLTSHFPFELEQSLWGLQLDNDVPEPLVRYYQSVNYTDRALQRFYELLERDGLLENTVFAVYGDHEGIGLEHLPVLYEELGIPQSNLLRETNRMSVAQVPFVVACGDPSRRIAHVSDKVGSTLDVGQTLLHLLGLPKIAYGMGANLFSAPEDRVVPLTQFHPGSFATRDALCCASESGDYVYSAIFDREKETMVLPVSGINKSRFEYSREKVNRSEHLIANDLLVPDRPSEVAEGEGAAVQAAFTPNIERLLSIADDEAVVIPITLDMDSQYSGGQTNPDEMKRLESYYRRARRKNIRFYSTIDWDANEQQIYFGDRSYADRLIEKGYQVEPVNPVSLPEYLRGLPDHSLIVVAAKDEASAQFGQRFVREMAEYGFHQLDVTKYRHSYANLIYKNKGYISLYEESTELPIEKNWPNGALIDGIALPCDLQVVSRGAAAGNLSEIKVNGCSCSRNQRGLNFAVVDMETGAVAEMFGADTFASTHIDTQMYRAFKERSSREVGA
ncbi:sulfatase-like hydrolase/transferase [Cohnella sp.]|uniref:sulfatase-like hydrolase/transferase n=1 Tax=Cohnella sp. TaxID=1883426 RepID=UPI00370420C1